MFDLDFMQSLDAISIVPLLLWLHWRGEQRGEKQEAKMEEQRRAADDRFEMMAKGWQKQLDSMMEKHEARENEIRDRWMRVVEKVEAEKKDQSEKMIEEIKNLSNRVEDVIRFISRPAGR